MTLSSPVKRSSRLDQRHQKLWCRKSSVCSVVRPGCWLRRTEVHHDDLLTQWWAGTVQPGTVEPWCSLAVGSSHFLRLARYLVLGIPGPFLSSNSPVTTKFSSCDFPIEWLSNNSCLSSPDCHQHMSLSDCSIKNIVISLVICPRSMQHYSDIIQECSTMFNIKSASSPILF